MTDPHPSMQPRRRLGLKIAIAVIFGLAVLGTALFFILKGALGPLVETGDGFMGALRDGNYMQAYMQATPDLQRALGSPEGLGATVANYRPASWSWSQRSVRNGYGYLSGSVTYRAGNEGTAELRMTQVDGQWHITSFQLN
jgi:hypothetical protein